MAAAVNFRKLAISAAAIVGGYWAGGNLFAEKAESHSHKSHGKDNHQVSQQNHI